MTSPGRSLPVHERPFTEAVFDTSDLPDLPQRDFRIPASGWRQAPDSLLSLGDDKFLPFVTEQFRLSGLDATKICFEITETAAIASYSQANRFINALKELGCKFALDDFGTGLSSFGYLKHFPVDFLKIDGSFVKEILHDPIDREMVRSINEIGHLTGKQTIAEFAENEEIITMLKGMGIDYAQGYGVSEPKRVTRAVA